LVFETRVKTVPTLTAPSTAPTPKHEYSTPYWKLFGPMSKLCAAMTGMRPTNASEKNENENNVNRMCEISESRRAMRTPDSSRAKPCSATRAFVRRGYFAHRSPITANR
jgi:hypothetical protein